MEHAVTICPQILSVFGAIIQSMHPWHLKSRFEVGEECQKNCGGKGSVMWERWAWSLAHAFLMPCSRLLVDDLPRQGKSGGLRKQGRKTAGGIILKRRKRKRRTEEAVAMIFFKKQQFNVNFIPFLDMPTWSYISI